MRGEDEVEAKYYRLDNGEAVTIRMGEDGVLEIFGKPNGIRMMGMGAIQIDDIPPHAHFSREGNAWVICCSEPLPRVPVQ